MKKILLLATTIYLLLASLTYHPDNKTVLNWASQDNGKVWDIWEYGETHLQSVGQFNYPPLHFYLDKLQYLIAKPIGGEGFYEWLSSPNSTDTNQVNLSRYSLALKIPIILFALAAAQILFLISKQFGASKKQAQLVASLWLFNPITIYSIPVMGQNDVMAIVFFLGAWYFLNSKKLLRASLLFGLGASIKMFPLMWLPFLLIADGKLLLKEKLRVFGVASLTYLATLLPFISNPVFRENAFNSGIDRMFMAELSLGYGDRFLIVPFLLMILVAGIFKYKKSAKNKTIIVRQAVILLLLNMIMLFFNHFHPQWLTWAVPFWSIWMISQEKKNFSLLAWISFSVFLAWGLITLLFNDAALSLGLLSILNTNLTALPTLRELITTHFFDVMAFNNYAHTWLAGLTVIFLINWYGNKNSETINKQSLIKLSLFKKSFSKTKKPHLYIISLLILLFSSFSLVFMANLIPTPLTGPSPKITSHPIFTTTIEQNFIADYNNLNRINLFFTNTGLKNRDLYRVTIVDDTEKIILQQEFSGFNTGHESSLRFNIDPQPSSQNRKYFVKITPPSISESPLRVGSLESDLPNTFAIKSYYQQPKGINLLKFAFTESTDTIKTIVEKSFGLFILLPILLWLAL